MVKLTLLYGLINLARTYPGKQLSVAQLREVGHGNTAQSLCKACGGCSAQKVLRTFMDMDTLLAGPQNWCAGPSPEPVSPLAPSCVCALPEPLKPLVMNRCWPRAMWPTRWRLHCRTWQHSWTACR